MVVSCHSQDVTRTLVVAETDLLAGFRDCLVSTAPLGEFSQVVPDSIRFGVWKVFIFDLLRFERTLDELLPQLRLNLQHPFVFA